MAMTMSIIGWTERYVTGIFLEIGIVFSTMTLVVNEDKTKVILASAREPK